MLSLVRFFALVVTLSSWAVVVEGNDDDTCEQVVFHHNAADTADALFGWTGFYSKGGSSIGGDHGGFEDTLFESHRWGSQFRYEFGGDFLGDQEYQITLGFAEVYTANCAVGKRKFDIHVNGELFVEEFDVFERIGCGNALVLDKRIESPGSGGKIVIEFSKGPNGANNAMVSFVQITKCQKDVTICPCWDELNGSQVYTFGKKFEGWTGLPHPDGVSYVYLRTLEGQADSQTDKLYKLTEEYDGSLTCNDDRMKLTAAEFGECKEQLLDAAQDYLDISYADHIESSCPDAGGHSSFSLNYDYYMFDVGEKICSLTNTRYNPAVGIFTDGFFAHMRISSIGQSYYQGYDSTWSLGNSGKNQCHKDVADLCIKEAIEYYLDF